jgi:hypothetical protein
MKQSGKAICLIIAAASLATIMRCGFPYEPRQQPSPEATSANPDTAAIGTGYLFKVNPGIQACNSSISQNSGYNGCMLWLGFDALSVVVPDTMTGYAATVELHDRLTVVDTANTVRWFIMRSAMAPQGELQCPEWSTHPDYIASLLGTMTQPYSGFAIRVSDHRFLKICDRRMEEFSTPHFWLPDSALSQGIVTAATYDTTGFVKKEHVRQFFNTSRVKVVYALPSRVGTLYFVDYDGAGEPVPVALPKPVGRESWSCASPLVSPDGDWVAYHCFANSSKGNLYASYIQRLLPGAVPVLVADAASDPHWWVDPFTKEYYIVYTVTHGEYFTEYDFSDPAVEARSVAGKTVKQRLKGSWMDGPAHMGGLTVDAGTPPYTLVRLPFKGGLSRDGYFLSTAYKFAYLMRLK